jgi:hypothetical protein
MLAMPPIERERIQTGDMISYALHTRAPGVLRARARPQLEALTRRVGMGALVPAEPHVELECQGLSERGQRQGQKTREIAGQALRQPGHEVALGGSDRRGSKVRDCQPTFRTKPCRASWALTSL